MFKYENDSRKVKEGGMFVAIKGFETDGHKYIEDAIKNGVKYLGLSEHAPSMPGGPHPFYFSNIKCIPSEVNGLKILRGIELNILDFDGKTDGEDEDMMRHIDYAIASLHPPCIEAGTKEQNTNAILITERRG